MRMWCICVSLRCARSDLQSWITYTCIVWDCLSIACSSSQQRKHQSSSLLSLCEGNTPVTGGPPHKVPVIWNALQWVCYQVRKLRVAHMLGMPGTFSPPPRVNDPDMHHGTCVTHVLWCMPGSLTRGFIWTRWRGKRSRHSRRMGNPQFYVSGKRPMVWRLHAVWKHCVLYQLPSTGS